jgi:uncharacterized membrane protein
MGMCKECGEVFSVLEMTNGICQNCATPENIAKAKEEDRKKKEKNEIELNKLGFYWWELQGWGGLILGNLLVLAYFFPIIFGSPDDLTKNIIIVASLIAINTILMIYILKYNKYAFLIATALSLNPITWIINGIYLKNRWEHPKVNRR